MVEVELEVGIKLGVRVMEGCVELNPKISLLIKARSSHTPLKIHRLTQQSGIPIAAKITIAMRRRRDGLDDLKPGTLTSAKWASTLSRANLW
jgi:hypothetical protein